MSLPKWVVHVGFTASGRHNELGFGITANNARAAAACAILSFDFWWRQNFPNRPTPECSISRLEVLL